MRKQTFTRIELIAVIVILAVSAFVLAGMLMPAGPHRDGVPRSLKSACINNLKQIGTAIVMYRDHNDIYPFGHITSPGNPRLITGHVTPRSAMGPDSQGSKDIRNLQVFCCPSQPKQAIGYQCIDGIPMEDEMDSAHAILSDFETNHGAGRQYGNILRGDMSVSGIDASSGTSWIASPRVQAPQDKDGKPLGWISNAP